jgi:hypothetical protein
VSTIAVVIPTIDGREHWLKRCKDAYDQNSTHGVIKYVIPNRPTCGQAWNDGWRMVDDFWIRKPDYIHLSADDLEPQPGWDEAAIEAVEAGALPCPLQTDADGTPWQWGRSTTPVPDWTPTTATTLPFLPWSLAEQILPGLDCHYYVDDYISWRARQLGWGDVYREGYRFIHHLAPEGRGAGMGSAEARMKHDLKIFEAAKEQWERDGFGCS